MEKVRLLSMSTGIMILLLLMSNLNAAEYQIKMLNQGKEGIMVFEPSSLKVIVGDTVKFISSDSGHNVMSYLVPKGGKGWQSTAGKGISVTLNKEGVYIYRCEPHTVMAMVGVIQVGKVTNKDAAMQAAKKLASQFSMNKERLSNYLAQLGLK